MMRLTVYFDGTEPHVEEVRDLNAATNTIQTWERIGGVNRPRRPEEPKGQDYVPWIRVIRVQMDEIEEPADQTKTE